MDTLVFYEKPGCITNTKQKKQLTELGIQFECRDMLTTAWTPQLLAPFFIGKDASEMLNPNSPRVKNGEIGLNQSVSAVLRQMAEDPLLIRRPLLKFKDSCWAGFNLEHILKKLERQVASDLKDGITPITETCSRSTG